MKKNLVVISISLFMIIATIVSCTEAKKPIPAIDPANLDKSVVPGNDFDTYANGGWKKLNPLPGRPQPIWVLRQTGRSSRKANERFGENHCRCE